MPYFTVTIAVYTKFTRLGTRFTVSVSAKDITQAIERALSMYDESVVTIQHVVSVVKDD